MKLIDLVVMVARESRAERAAAGGYGRTAGRRCATRTTSRRVEASKPLLNATCTGLAWRRWAWGCAGGSSGKHLPGKYYSDHREVCRNGSKFKRTYRLLAQAIVAPAGGLRGGCNSLLQRLQRGGRRLGGCDASVRPGDQCPMNTASMDGASSTRPAHCSS